MIQEIQAKLKKVENCSSISDYLNNFFLCYGIPRATLMRLGLENAIPEDKEIIIGNKLFCEYTKAENLYARYDIVQRQMIKNNRYRFVMLINDKDILALDTNNGEWLSVARNNIHSEFEFFLPLVGIERTVISNKENASTKIGEKFAQYYNEMLLLNPGKEEEIGLLLVNLVAAFFADSCGILERGTIHRLIDLYSSEDGMNLESILVQIFNGIIGKKGLPDYVQNSCKGSVHGLPSYCPSLIFDFKTRKTLLSLCGLNWDSVEPEVIGALLQAILNQEDTTVAYNYTSTANVYKVIGPLFIDDLYEEYEYRKKEETLSEDLLDKISNISVFDPSCGTGNFLMICFKELKKLEKLIKVYCVEHSIEIEDKSYVSIENFYGIEQNDIATQVCRIGMAFTNLKISDFPIKKLDLPVHNICTGRALLMDWSDFCPQNGSVYIVGNPSYKGAHSLNKEQQQEMRVVYSEEIDNGFKIGELDYATGYFYKATQYIKGTQNGFAFVTTNSLTQGIHVPTLWPLLFSKGINISFAYTSFKWKNEGRNTTAVTVVIIGCRSVNNPHIKTIYDRNLSYDADSISPYLTKGGVIVQKENRGPISKDLPKMLKGNMPYGKGLLLDSREKKELIEQYPSAKQFLKRVVGSQEYIHGQERWCLWISDEQLEEQS